MEVNETKPFKKLRRFIKKIDFFGITFDFRSHNRAKFSSVCSGLVFIFYCFFISAYILKSFSDYIGFSDYRIQYMQRYNENSNLKITKDNFFYSFRFTFVEGLSYNDMMNITKTDSQNSHVFTGQETNVFGSVYEQLFEIDNRYVERVTIPSSASKKKIINKYICEEEKLESSDFYELLVANKFNPLKNEYEESFMVKDQVCFDYSSFNLYGTYSDYSFSYFEVTLKLNETYFKMNPNTVKTLLSGVTFKFSLYYSDHIYDISNLNDPIQKRIESTIYSYVDIDYYERKDVFFNELVYSTDKNLLVKDPYERKKIRFSETSNSVSPMKFRYDINSKSADKYNLIRYYIRPNLKQTVINVSYMKIPEFLSGVSAMSMNIFVGLNILCGFFNRIHATQKIISKTMRASDIYKEIHKKQIAYFLNVSNSLKKITHLTPHKTKLNLLVDKNNNRYKHNKTLICHESPENCCNSLYSRDKYSNLDDPSCFDEKKNLNNFKRKNDSNSRAFSSCFNADNSKSTLFMDKINQKDGIQLTDFKNNDNGNIKSEKTIYHSNLNNPNDSSRSNTNLVLNDPILEISDCNIDENKVNRDPQKLNKLDNINVPNDHSTNLKINSKSEKIVKKNSIKKCNEMNITKNNNYNKNVIDIFPNNMKGSLKADIKQHKTLKISNLDLISIYLCCRDLKQKKVFFNLAKLKFDENLNFLNYSKKMMEFDIIKYLIMDKNLLEVMNFISKPNISEDTEFAFKDPEYNSFFNNEQIMGFDDDSHLNRLKEAYENLIKASDGNGFNSFVRQRMIKLFHFQIQELK